MQGLAHQLLIFIGGQGSRLALYPLLRLEALIAVTAIAVAIWRPCLCARLLAAGEVRLAALARKRRLAVMVCGVAVVVTRILLLPIMPVPKPIIHDEFSHLFGAATFAAGRLVTPAHALWQHFETFYILPYPLMASMYPPGSALVMGAAQALTGNPWVGVLLGSALCCCAICWALQGFMPAEWAFAGGLFVALRIGIFSYWTNTYMGGSLAALGGALAIGALPRLRQEPGVRSALILAAGLVLLANTRAYEGVCFALPIACALMLSFLRSPIKAAWLRRVILPVAAVGLAAGGAMTYYFYRVTGSPLVMPYSVYGRQYKTTTEWLIGGLRPMPVYRIPAMKALAIGEREVYSKFHSVRGFVARNLSRLRQAWMFYIGPLFLIPFLLLPCVARQRRLRWLLLCGGATALGLSLELFMTPHYAAPATCVVAAVVVEGLRRLRTWRFRGRPSGLFLARALPIGMVTVLVVRVIAGAIGWQPNNEARSDSPGRTSWCCVGPGGTSRAAVARDLVRGGGKHLIIVRYVPEHEPWAEWVYNEPDIDGQPVVWARDLGKTANESLVKYFKDRRIWQFEPDKDPLHVAPYK